MAKTGRPTKSEFPAYKKAKTDGLIPYARNSRTHSDEQVSQIAASIKEFGFLNPIIVDGDNGIIAGHGRVLAAQKLGLAELPVIEAAHLSETQRRAYVIADNKLALNAGWDDQMLRVELDEIGGAGFDLEITGFSLDEIDGISFDDNCETDMPEMPEGDRDLDSLGTITIRLPVHECEEVKSFLSEINPNDPSGAMLEVARGRRKEHTG